MCGYTKGVKLYGNHLDNLGAKIRGCGGPYLTMIEF
jgi:hypothetical protein